MAKKRKRRPPRPAATAAAPAAAPGPRGGANVARRERKEEARRLREAEMRRARRSSAFRRTFTSLGVVAAAVAGIVVFQSLSGPNPIPEEAKRAATAAGCTEVEQPAGSAPGGQHLEAGAPYEYPDTPATSGFHDPSPLPDEPKVYDEQPPETNAVHSLEHGAVLVYYLPGEGGLSQEIVDRLASVANGSEATFLAPYPGLTAERALTLTAWNRRQSCPAGEALTPERAATIASGFVEAFECINPVPGEIGVTPC
jgi:Protein of unknown function (DUF3105)